MNNGIQNLLIGVGCLLISLILFILKDKIIYSSKNKKDTWHYSIEQKHNKMIIGIIAFISFGLLLIIFSLTQLFT